MLDSNIVVRNEAQTVGGKKKRNTVLTGGAALKMNEQIQRKVKQHL